VIVFYSLLVAFRISAAATGDGAHARQQLLEKNWLLDAPLRTEAQHAATLTTRDDRRAVTMA